jgi:1,4-alpha-glucan branching enzyme
MMIGSYDFSPAEQDFSLGPPRVTRAADGHYDVAFRYRPPTRARSVHLAGTFNEWKPTALAMSGPDKDGLFTTTQQLPIGRYEYKFVVDGRDWKTDPGNMSRAGSYRNSVLVVGRLYPPTVTRATEGKYSVLFRYHPSKSCKSVAVAGTFNHWKATGHEMQGPDGEGWYTTTLELAEGRHEYKFVMDGKDWERDPGNPVVSGKKHSSVVWAKP